jgi:hypothetical protein
MLPVPFSKEIDQAFRQDRNLPRKLIGAVIVGLSVGCVLVVRSSHNDRRGPRPFVYACVIGLTIVACVLAVFGLSLRDVVRRRMHDGEHVNIVLRLYLASGLMSLILGIATAIIIISLLAWVFLP